MVNFIYDDVKYQVELFNNWDKKVYSFLVKLPNDKYIAIRSVKLSDPPQFGDMVEIVNWKDFLSNYVVYNAEYR